MVAKVAAEEIIKKWLAPALAGGAAATQSEDSEAIFAGLAAKGANRLGAKAAHDEFQRHMEISPSIFTNFEDLIESGAMQSEAARNAGSSRQSWFIGADGKPRYEINDANASIVKDFDKGVARSLANKIEEGSSGGGRQHVTAPLNYLLNHDSLFNAYPKLADTNLHIWKPGSDLLGDTPAAYTPPRDGQPMGELHINLQGIIDEDRNETLRSLLHEAQHAIQTEEGFARGSNVGAAMGDIRNYVRDPQKHGAMELLPMGDDPWKVHGAIVEPKMERLQKILSAGDSAPNMDAPDYIKEEHKEITDLLAYLMSAGEAEARSVESRLRMPAKLRASDHGHPYGDMRMPKDQAEYFFGDGQQGPTLFQMIEMLTRDAP